MMKMRVSHFPEILESQANPEGSPPSLRQKSARENYGYIGIATFN